MPREWDIKFRIHRAEKELHELYRLRKELDAFARKGSESDKANLKMVEEGLEIAKQRIRELKQEETGK